MWHVATMMAKGCHDYIGMRGAAASSIVFLPVVVILYWAIESGRHPNRLGTLLH